MSTRIFSVAILILASGAATLPQSSAAPAPSTQESPKPAAPAKNDYSNPDFWLCRPGRQDACSTDLSTTVISAGGKLTVEPWSADPNAPIDCFYVYPTVSRFPAGNSDMTARVEEKSVVRAQFARFASKCRLYAPIYRQVTITALRAALIGIPIPVDRILAYNDVVDAWKYYLDHDNHGRGVVLIGHSQGSNILTALIRNEIEGKPAQPRIISALLLGASIPVPAGKDVGGAFHSMPLCRSAAQIGCIITYSSFRATSPPPANTRFGKVPGENMIAACTNPAALAGGSGELHAYLGAHSSGVSVDENAPTPWVKPPQPINTPYVSVPGMLTAECVSDATGSYLSITVHPDPSNARTNDIAGDVFLNGRVFPDWGLHLIDVHVAMGNLLDIVAQQSKSYLAANSKK